MKIGFYQIQIQNKEKKNNGKRKLLEIIYAPWRKFGCIKEACIMKAVNHLCVKFEAE